MIDINTYHDFVNLFLTWTIFVFIIFWLKNVFIAVINTFTPR